MRPRPIFDGCELPLGFAFDPLVCFLVNVVSGGLYGVSNDTAISRVVLPGLLTPVYIRGPAQLS
jgi:hypothetical protein